MARLQQYLDKDRVLIRGSIQYDSSYNFRSSHRGSSSWCLLILISAPKCTLSPLGHIAYLQWSLFQPATFITFWLMSWWVIINITTASYGIFLTNQLHPFPFPCPRPHLMQPGMKTVRIFSDRIQDRIRFKGFRSAVSKSEYSISDTISVSEYLNCIFMMLISNCILSDMVDIIRIRIRIRPEIWKQIWYRGYPSVSDPFSSLHATHHDSLAASSPLDYTPRPLDVCWTTTLAQVIMILSHLWHLYWCATSLSAPAMSLLHPSSLLGVVHGFLTTYVELL